jgi:hypothetical protein
MPQYVIFEELDDGTKVERLEWGAHSVWFKTNQTFPYCVYDPDGTAVYPVTDAERQVPRKGFRYISYSRLSWTAFKDPEWRRREQRRFDLNEYEALPWDLPVIEDHYAHVSVEDGAKVAFTPSPEKGMVDVQVRMKPGRYLTKFYPHLSADKVRAYAIALDKAIGVRFAVTTADIVRVYLNGPNSCMSHATNTYASNPIHPCAVYGDSDLQLAYLGAKDISEPDFRASARALVWPAKKIWVRIYGDEGRLSAALEELGYSESDSFEGATINVLRTDNGKLVLPYLDGDEQGVTLRGNKLRITDERYDWRATGTNGLAEGEEEDEDGEEEEEDREFCDYYQEYVDGTTHYISDVEQHWCSQVIRDHAYYCAGNFQYYSIEYTPRFVIDGHTYSEPYLEGCTYAVCDGDGNWSFKNQLPVEVTLDAAA